MKGGVCLKLKRKMRLVSCYSRLLTRTSLKDLDFPALLGKGHRSEASHRASTNYDDLSRHWRAELNLKLLKILIESGK